MATLKEALRKFVEFKDLKATSVAQYECAVKRCFPEWLDLELESITRLQLIDKYNYLVNNPSPKAKSGGKGAANAAFRVLRAVFNFASAYFDYEKQLLNPVKVISAIGQWRKTSDRTTYIPAERFAEWYRFIAHMPSLDRDYYLVLILTGARASEIGDLTWDEVDLVRGILNIPPERTKGKKWHNQAVSRQVWNILRERRLLSVSPRYVFADPQAPNEPYPQGRRAYERINQKMGIDSNPHALRRTFATTAKYKCKIEKFVVKRCLNHVITDITERYIQTDPEELRPYYQMVSDYMLLQMRGSKPKFTLPLNA